MLTFHYQQSGADKKKLETPLFYQGSTRSTLPVTWDYHVILIHHHPLSTACVYDFDSTLPFPTPFAQYYELTLKGDKVWADPEVDQVALRVYLDRRMRRFRIVAAEEYLRCFASSREHMKMAGSEDGSAKWMAEPPGYPPIRCGLGEDTLGSLLEFGEGEGMGFGRVVDEQGFWEEFVGGGDG
jgi:hypothetical protein